MKWKIFLVAGGVVIAVALNVGVRWRAQRADGDSRATKWERASAGVDEKTVFAVRARAKEEARSVSREEVNASARLSVKFMTALRLKLAEWRALETGATAAQERIVEEWLALLDNAPVGEVVLALSEDELAAPLGVAAFDRWLKTEREDALQWIKTRRRGSEAETLLVVQALLDSPKRLSAFCEELPDCEWKQVFLATAGLQAVGKEPALVLELAERMEAGTAQTNVLQTFAYDWMTRDSDAATAWLLTVEDPGLKELLFAAGAKAIAVTDPDLAVRWISAGIKSESVLLDTALCVVGLWADRDPAKAGGWVTQFPAGQVREAAVELMSRRWMQADPAAAKAWIGCLPEGADVLARLQSEEFARVAVEVGE